MKRIKWLSHYATEQAVQLYEQLMDKGYQDDGTQALIKLWWPEGSLPS